MANIHIAPDTHQKLQMLADDAKYDLACACASNKTDHRRLSADGSWIYPTTMADGRRTYLFRTLLSSHCANDCKYCPLRRDQDPVRTTLTPFETARTFMDYWRAGKVGGLFLSSGLFKSPDGTMEQLLDTVHIVRRMGFRGYVHLKIMPGASEAAIADAISVSSAVSLNIEAPGEKRFCQLSQSKNYMRDVINPMKTISNMIRELSPHRRVKQTTQFIVGAADETDKEIVKYMAAGYERLNLHRIYFSAWQPGEIPLLDLDAMEAARGRAVREHRLYQVDFLLRKYGFTADDIAFDNLSNLDANVDPKTLWANLHPEFFPLNINKASKVDLLKIPGLGPTTVARILDVRKSGGRVTSLDQVGKLTKTLQKAENYVRFD